MRLPSIKTLSEIFGDNAKTARLILEGALNPLREPERFPATCKWVDSCYNRPSRAEIKMSALNELGEFYGTEAVFSDRSCTVPAFEYLSAGDTYAATLIRLDTGTYLVSTYGDTVERLERRGYRFE